MGRCYAYPRETVLRRLACISQHGTICSTSGNGDNGTFANDPMQRPNLAWNVSYNDGILVFTFAGRWYGQA